MKKWNLIIIVSLIILAIGSCHASASEPNDISVEIQSLAELMAKILTLAEDVNGIIADINSAGIDANIISPGDGFLLGAMVTDSARAGEGSLLAKIGYQYGISQLYFAADVERGRYYEGGVKFESRNLNQDGSVKFLSSIVTALFPDNFDLTGTAGLGYAWDGNATNGLTIGGINVRPPDKRICFEFEAVTPFDRRVELRGGLLIRF